MRVSHHPLLVALALLVGVAAAFVVIGLHAHATSARGRARLAWLAGTVGAGALGIWSVHFVGMLSLRLSSGTRLAPIEYDLPQMLVPVLVAAAAGAMALAVTARHPPRLAARLAAGLLLGAGIVGAHYTAMPAMRVAASRSYAPALVVASVLVAALGAVGVVLVGARLGRSLAAGIERRLGLSCLAGGVVAATHYTAMAAARFAPNGHVMHVESRHLMATDGVAVAVAAVVLLTLGLALLATSLDRRARAQQQSVTQLSQLYLEAQAARRAVEDSERRFRMLADTGPAMVWLSDPDGRRTFVGHKWRELTGGAGDAGDADDDWAACVCPEDREACLASYHDAIRARRPFRLEYRVRRHDGSPCWVLDTGVPRETAQGELAGYVGTCIDITSRRETEEAQQYLLEVARVLATSLDFDAVLRHVIQLLVPRLGDYCIVHMRSASDRYVQLAAAHADPRQVPLLEELAQRYQPDLDNPRSPVARALTATEPVIADPSPEMVHALTKDPEVVRIFAELAPTAMLVVPLKARGEPFGVITLAMSSSGRSFGPQDRTAAELFAARAALALDNARLYTEARRARDEVIRVSQLESQMMRTRLESLRAQLNPHFLFNALNTIAMLVRRQANHDALQGIVNLSDLLRRSLAEQSALLVPLGTELPLLESYVAIERLRFRDRLHIRIDIAPDTVDALVPGLLLQPLVENAIKHGIARRREAGSVSVCSWREADVLAVEVCDDGPGFPPGWDPATSGGIGLANTRERLERLYDGAHKFEAATRAEGGARVTVRVPFQTASAIAR